MKQKSTVETELKLRIPATAPLRARLAALGFHEVTPAQPEQSTLWDREGRLRAENSALRTRSFAGRSRLTWKGPRVPDALLKIRPELETGIEDGPTLEAILRSLGFDLFSFDFRNHGESAAEAGLIQLQWLSDRELTDLRAALAYLRTRPDADPAVPPLQAGDPHGVRRRPRRRGLSASGNSRGCLGVSRGTL